MKKPLITTLLAATVASAILAAPGGAGKPAYSATCVVGTGGLTAVTWISGTTVAHVTWRATDSTLGDTVDIAVTTHGPDGTAVDTPQQQRMPTLRMLIFDGKKPGHALGDCTHT